MIPLQNSRNVVLDAIGHSDLRTAEIGGELLNESRR